jgi:hypothetical protein
MKNSENQRHFAGEKKAIGYTITVIIVSIKAKKAENSQIMAYLTI